VVRSHRPNLWHHQSVVLNGILSVSCPAMCHVPDLADAISVEPPTSAIDGSTPLNHHVLEVLARRVVMPLMATSSIPRSALLA
jgi:hypothetical protein